MKNRTEILQLEKDKISVDREKVFNLAAGEDKEDVFSTKREIIKYIGECHSLISPRAAFTCVTGRPADRPGEITIGNTSFHPGKIIRNMLRHSTEYVLFATTIGEGPENLARKLMEKGSYLEGYLVDLIGSALVESASDLVHDQIREMAECDGYRVTNRYSPGYCGWEVSEQQKLFGLLPAHVCGITLSDSSLMNPIKSVSGLIGIGPSVAFRDYTCELCSMTHCAYRSVRPSSPS